MSDKCIIVRGGGDLASGVIHRLHRCGYRVLILECEKPSAIRRKVAFCEAVYDGTAAVEGISLQKNRFSGRMWAGLASRGNSTYGRSGR